MNKTTQSLLYIHIAVLLFGAAGLFGKTLLLPAIIITFGRVLFASLGLGTYFIVRKHKIRLTQRSHYFIIAFSGLLLAFHWFSFFFSIQLSTVAIGLLTFSTFPIFTVFLEPVFFKEKFKFTSLALALITFVGIYLIIPSFNMENSYFQGALWGIISGLTFSIIQLINRNYVKKYSSLTITFYEVLVATIILLPFSFLIDYSLRGSDILMMVLLGLVFTAFAHSIFIRGLRKVNVLSASIIGSLEPVYGILFAFLLLSEIPDFRTIIGGLLIIVSNLSVMLRNKK